MIVFQDTNHDRTKPLQQPYIKTAHEPIDLQVDVAVNAFVKSIYVL
jgi:hypothetical protein